MMAVAFIRVGTAKEIWGKFQLPILDLISGSTLQTRDPANCWSCVCCCCCFKTEPLFSSSTRILPDTDRFASPAVAGQQTQLCCAGYQAVGCYNSADGAGQRHQQIASQMPWKGWRASWQSQGNAGSLEAQVSWQHEELEKRHKTRSGLPGFTGKGQNCAHMSISVWLKAFMQEKKCSKHGNKTNLQSKVNGQAWCIYICIQVQKQALRAK